MDPPFIFFSVRYLSLSKNILFFVSTGKKCKSILYRMQMNKKLSLGRGNKAQRTGHFENLAFKKAGENFTLLRCLPTFEPDTVFLVTLALPGKGRLRRFSALRRLGEISERNFLPPCLRPFLLPLRCDTSQGLCMGNGGCGVCSAQCRKR